MPEPRVYEPVVAFCYDKRYASPPEPCRRYFPSKVTVTLTGANYMYFQHATFRLEFPDSPTQEFGMNSGELTFWMNRVIADIGFRNGEHEATIWKRPHACASLEGKSTCSLEQRIALARKLLPEH